MTKKNTIIKASLAAGLLLLLGICCSCGTSEYQRRLEDRIKELKTGSKFNILSPPVKVPGTSVSLRVPQDFNDQTLTEGAVIDGKPVDLRRVKTNLIDIPDLKLTFEGFIVDASGGKQPFYLYVAVSTDPGKMNFTRNIHAELSGKFNNTTGLTDYQVQTPEGRTSDWKTCRATGNQVFYYVTPNGDSSFRQMSGVMELLIHDENETLVILAWRMPSTLEQSKDFKTWINLVAGCVKVSP